MIRYVNNPDIITINRLLHNASVEVIGDGGALASPIGSLVDSGVNARDKT